MASMEDLIATISGGMHVSQESYELEKFKAHLARTLVVPVVPLSPELSPRQLAPSSYGYTFNGLAQPYPSPAAHLPGFPGYFDDSDVPQPTHGHRPSHPYPFPSHQQAHYRPELSCSEPSSLTTGFAGDAFAPLWEEQAAAPSPAADPWQRFRPATAQQENSAALPWSGFGTRSIFTPAASHNASGVNPSATLGLDFNHSSQLEHRLDDVANSNDSMDEDLAEDLVIEPGPEEDTVERVMGLESQSVYRWEQCW